MDDNDIISSKKSQQKSKVPLQARTSNLMQRGTDNYIAEESQEMSFDLEN